MTADLTFERAEVVHSCKLEQFVLVGCRAASPLAAGHHDKASNDLLRLGQRRQEVMSNQL